MREKLTREEAIKFCEDRVRLHSNGRDHIYQTADIIEDEIARAKYNSYVDLINIYTDIADLLRQN